MKLTAEDCRVAAREHLALAGRAWKMNEFFVAHYHSGIAVECILRAYDRRRNQDWYSRHDMHELGERARFAELAPEQEQGEWKARLVDLNLRWRSEHRYFSEQALKRYIVGANLHRERQRDGKAGYVKGDLIKANARWVRNLAQEIVGLGEAKWR